MANARARTARRLTVDFGEIVVFAQLPSVPARTRNNNRDRVDVSSARILYETSLKLDNSFCDYYTAITYGIAEYERRAAVSVSWNSEASAGVRKKMEKRR